MKNSVLDIVAVDVDKDTIQKYIGKKIYFNPKNKSDVRLSSNEAILLSVDVRGNGQISMRVKWMSNGETGNYYSTDFLFPAMTIDDFQSLKKELESKVADINEKISFLKENEMEEFDPFVAEVINLSKEIITEPNLTEAKVRTSLLAALPKLRGL